MRLCAAMCCGWGAYNDGEAVLHCSTATCQTLESITGFRDSFLELVTFYGLEAAGKLRTKCTRGETLLLLAHAISLTAALMCAVPYSSREKAC
ncbi:hypothetical protein JOQ06_025212, partial [Pogonophryne albipinna]